MSGLREGPPELPPHNAQRDMGAIERSSPSCRACPPVAGIRACALSSDAVSLALALEPAEGVVPSSENSGLGYGSVALPSLEPGVETGTTAADGVGATAALTRNPVEARKIANDNTKPMEYASSVLVAHAD